MVQHLRIGTGITETLYHLEAFSVNN